MSYKEINMNEKKVIGIKIRTTNKGGQSIKDQSEFWQKIFNENLIEKIPNKINPDEILGVYYDFESDFMGEYTFLIGFEVNNFENIPDNMTSIIIPESKFAVFTNNKRINIAEKIGSLWQEIWNTKIDRAYTGEYEIYKLSTMNSDNPVVDIYVSIK